MRAADINFFFFDKLQRTHSNNYYEAIWKNILKLAENLKELNSQVSNPIPTRVPTGLRDIRHHEWRVRRTSKENLLACIA